MFCSLSDRDGHQGSPFGGISPSTTGWLVFVTSNSAGGSSSTREIDPPADSLLAASPSTLDQDHVGELGISVSGGQLPAPSRDFDPHQYERADVLSEPAAPSCLERSLHRSGAVAVRQDHAPHPARIHRARSARGPVLGHFQMVSRSPAFGGPRTAPLALCKARSVLRETDGCPGP
jgi:hypothetical protein